MLKEPPRRLELLSRLHETIASGRIILGIGTGIGLTAKLAEMVGVDFILVYNSGRFRMAGRGSLAGLMPYGSANEIVVEMATEILPVLHHQAGTATVAGVCASDPFRKIDQHLTHLRSLGFSGIQNFPTVGLIDGRFRAELESTGMGYSCEVELMQLAHSPGFDFLTMPYVFTVDEAKEMMHAGADIIVVHLGLTSGGILGSTGAADLDSCIETIQEIQRVCVEIRDDVIVMCHGGSIASADDMAYVLERTTGLHGFIGASSIERLPVEVAVMESINAFKKLRSV